MHKTSRGRNQENCDYVPSLRRQHLSVIWTCIRTNVKQRVCSRLQDGLTDYLLCEPSVTDNVSNSSVNCILRELPLPLVQWLFSSSNSSSFFGCWGTLVLSYKKCSMWKTEHVLWIFACFLTEAVLTVANVSYRKWQLNAERNPVFLISFFLLSQRFFSLKRISKGFLENSFSWDETNHIYLMSHSYFSGLF